MTDKPPQSSPTQTGSLAAQPGMAQCSITKKWFPEDELVTFKGQMVSAEGKQILLDHLRTGADAPGALRRPGVAARFWCIFLDFLLLGVLAVLIQSALGMRLWEPHRYNRLQHQALGLAAYALEVSLDIFYFGFFHGWKGKSLAKMAGNLRVVNLDGTSISKPKAFARAAAFQIGPIVTLFSALLAMLTSDRAIYDIGLLLSYVWMLFDGVFALIDSRTQRSLHDRICGTRVIEETL